MIVSGFTEDHLVEQPAIQLMLHELGWEVVNCYDEWSGGVSNQGRDGKREVVLVSRLRPALQRLNPDLPVEAIEGAVEEMEILSDEFWILNGRGRHRQCLGLIWRRRTGRSNDLAFHWLLVP